MVPQNSVRTGSDNGLSLVRKLAIILSHWGRVTHICVSKLTIIGSDNGLSPERRQAIIWTNAGILLIGPLGTNFSEILIEIQTFSLKKIHLKMSSVKCCSFRLGLNVLTNADLLLNGPLEKTSVNFLQNFNIFIQDKKMFLKLSSAKWQPFWVRHYCVKMLIYIWG